MVSVSGFDFRVSVMSLFMFGCYTFSSVWVVEWPPFGKQLPTQLTICSYVFCLFVIFIYFPFWC